MYRVFKIVAHLVVFLVGMYLIETGIEHLMTNKSPVKAGTCYLKYGDVIGFTPANSTEECKKFTNDVGAEFIKFDQKEDKALAEVIDTDANRAKFLAVSHYLEKKSLKDFRYPVRIVIGYDSLTINAITQFATTLFMFLTVFFILMYFRRKNRFISYPFAIAVSLTVVCIFVNFSGIIDNVVQYYVKIGNSAYLLSGILNFITFFYVYCWAFSAYFYHKGMHEDREMTPLLQQIYSLADDVKGFFEK